MTDLQRVFHERIITANKYGINDEYNTGFSDGIAWALHQLVKQDGENRTGCTAYDQSARR